MEFAEVVSFCENTRKFSIRVKRFKLMLSQVICYDFFGYSADTLDPVSRVEVDVILTNEKNGEISGKTKIGSKKDGIYGVRFMFKSYRLKPTLKKALRIYNVIFF